MNKDNIKANGLRNSKFERRILRITNLWIYVYWELSVKRNTYHTLYKVSSKKVKVESTTSD